MPDDPDDYDELPFTKGQLRRFARNLKRELPRLKAEKGATPPAADASSKSASACSSANSRDRDWLEQAADDHGMTIQGEAEIRGSL